MPRHRDRGGQKEHSAKLKSLDILGNMQTPLLGEKRVNEVSQPGVIPVEGGSFRVLLRWRGTVLSHIWPVIILSAVIAAIICQVFRANNVAKYLKPLHDYISNHTTFMAFLLTFYLNTTYGVFQKGLNTSRSIQGSIGRISLLLAHTGVDAEVNANCQVVLHALSGCVWAIFGTLDTSLAHKAEVRVRSKLLAAGVEHTYESSGPEECLGWKAATLLLHAASRQGHSLVKNENVAFHVNFDRELVRLRSSLGTLTDLSADGGGLHVAYSHLMTITTISLMILAPISFFSDMGTFAIVAAPITIFLIVGILDLGRQFQHPFSGYIRIDSSKLLGEIDAKLMG